MYGGFKTDYPKADNRKVLRPYSESMKSLLKRGSYNAGKRPSEHSIGEKSFLMIEVVQYLTIYLK